MFFVLACLNELKFCFMQASALITDICQNLSTAAKSVGNNDYTVVLRGDSTLRGHFPEVRIYNLCKGSNFKQFTY